MARDLLLGSLFTLCLSSAPLAACPLIEIDAYDTVSSIIDGDSLKLQKYGEVRLIGINTPEYYQPLGSQATRSLKKLASGKQVAVQFGKSPADRYGRKLVHLQTVTGINLAAQQLQSGYAFHILVPPNDRYARCYARSEKIARSKQLNIWNKAAYQPRSASSKLGAGFQRIQGRIENLRFVSTGAEISIARSKLSLFIPKAYWPSFGGREALEQWRGADFIARGWVRQRKNRLSLGLEHPYMLEYLAKEGNPPD